APRHHLDDLQRLPPPGSPPRTVPLAERTASVTALLILFVLVAGIVLVTARWKVSPFLALMGASLIGGFAFGLPPTEIVETITEAFGSTLGNIGLVILFGTMIGMILERSGAAISMAEALIKVLG